MAFAAAGSSMTVKWLVATSATSSPGTTARNSASVASGTMNPPFSGAVARTSNVGIVSALHIDRTRSTASMSRSSSHAARSVVGLHPASVVAELVAVDVVPKWGPRVDDPDRADRADVVLRRRHDRIQPREPTADRLDRARVHRARVVDDHEPPQPLRRELRELDADQPAHRPADEVEPVGTELVGDREHVGRVRRHAVGPRGRHLALPAPAEIDGDDIAPRVGERARDPVERPQRPRQPVHAQHEPAAGITAALGMDAA